MSSTLNAPARYDRFTRFMHWLVALIIIYAMLMGYILHALEGTPWFRFFSVVNMSLGTIATPVMIIRFTWRFFRPSTPYPAVISQRKKQWIVFMHEIFYLTIFVVLISGFIMLQKEFTLFGLIPVAQPVKLPEVNAFFFQLHRYSCIALGVMLAGHVGFVVKYWFSGQRDIVRRML